MKFRIAIPFAQIESINPNLGQSSYQKSRDIYFKNIYTCFFSIRKHNPEITLQLFTNEKLPPSLERRLEEIGVITTIVPFRFQPPSEYGDIFRGCFYIFDAIAQMEESTLFIDPDVICSQEIGLVQYKEQFAQERIGIFDPKFSETKRINGLTHVEAVSIYNSLLGTSVSPGRHVGGECFFLPISLRNRLLQDFEKYWQEATRKTHILEKRYLTTEEHILSLLVLQFPSFDLGNLIARIWTTKTYRKIEGRESIEELPLWHLPSEKEKGLMRIYDFLDSNKIEYLNFSRNEEISFLRKSLSLNFVMIRNVISTTLSFVKKIGNLRK